MTDTTPNDVILWKARAEGVERELRQIAEGFRAMDTAHPHHIHHLFADLYLCTTRRWLARLSQSDDSEYAYRVIVRFLEFYVDQVPRRLDHPLSEIEAHWRSYHKRARRQTIRSPISAHLILISSGVRAHIQGDLGRAMCIVEEEIGHHATSKAHAAAEQEKMLGEDSDTMFYDAALDHVAAQTARHTGWRRMILNLYRVGLYVLKPIWIPVFQHWRSTGYTEAAADVQSRYGPNGN